MKILFLTRSFYPNVGGVEKHVLEIGSILSDFGHEITVITEKNLKTYSTHYQLRALSAKNEGKAKKIRTLTINAGEDGWLKKLRVWKEMLKHIRTIYSSDIVHCHDVFFWYIPFKMLFPLKKVYTTFHGYEGNNLPTRKAILMHKISEKLSDGNICVGGFLKKWYGTKPTFVTYGAVNKELIKTGSKKINQKKSNKVAFVGRLEKETGILTYLKALKLLSQESINLQLDIYGEGSIERQVINYSRANDLKISVKGFISNIESVLKNYEYVFCSRYLSILESLSLKQIVFAEYNNEIKKNYLEMTPFSNFINIAGTPQEIADQFKKAIKGNSINIRGYEWVKDKTWENLTDAYLRLWNT